MDAHDSPFEREARAIASGTASAPKTCPRCATGTPCATCSSSTTGAGTPLTREQRAEWEPMLGADLGAIRLHTDGDAARSARAMGVNAYAAGSQIVFGDGRYAPQTSEGRRLLLHELVHTVQDPEGRVVHADGPEWDPALGTDPCSVQASGLTNTELLAEYLRAEAYVRDPAHNRRDHFYSFRWLWRQCGQERDRRARAGESWLADTSLRAVPGTLHRLEPGPNNSVMIVEEAGSAAAGAPRSYSDISVVTSGQLQTYLARYHVEQSTIDQVMADPSSPHLVDVTTANMVWQMAHPQRPPGTDLLQLFNPGFGGTLGSWQGGRQPSFLASEIHRGFQIGIGRNYNTPLRYQGIAGEYGFLATDPLGAGPYVDLDATGGNYPDYDFLSTSDRLLPQVKTRRGPTDQPQVTGSYLEGLEGIQLHPSEPHERTRALARLQQLGSDQGVHLGTWVAIAGGRLVVNPEDVTVTRAEVVSRITTGGADFYQDVYRGLLWGNDVQHNGTRYTVADFNRDRAANAVPAAVTAEVARLASMQVVGGGVSGDQVVRVTDLVTSGMGPGVGARDAAERVTPLQMEGAVTGRSPYRRAAGMGALGDLAGGGLMILLHRAHAAATGHQYASTWSDDLRGFTVSTPASAAISALEIRMQDAALQQIARGGVGSLPFYLRPGAMRYGLPAITAPAITAAQMGLSGHDYPWQEYVVQGTRSGFNALVAAGFVATVGAFAVGGAEAGAVGGTAVAPGPGTGVGGGLGFVGGIIVGSIGYALSDFIIGDTVEDITRSAVGDPAGCPR